MVHQLLNTPLSPTNYNKVVNKIKQIAVFNGFEEKIIDKINKKKNWI